MLDYTLRPCISAKPKTLQFNKKNNMELGNIIFGAITLTICIGPLVIMYYRSVNTNRKMLQSLKEIAQQYNCNIDKHEFCNNSVIGLDKQNKHVFFFKKKEGASVSQFVNLSEIQDCKAIKRTNATTFKNEDVTLFEKIELKFIPINKNKGEISFELYGPENRQVNGELQMADRWSAQIAEHIKSK